MSIRIIQSILLVFFLAVALACNNLIFGTPNDEKIKADLIGKEINSGLSMWKFDSLSEFESFKIIDTQSSGNIVEYKVDVVLKDFSDGDTGYATLLVNYRKENSEWKLANVTAGNSLRIERRK
jgi:hypothetical protein